jgi:hypothetical protein
VEHPLEMSYPSLQSPSCLVPFLKNLLMIFVGIMIICLRLFSFTWEFFSISRCVVSTFVHDSSFGSIRSISWDDPKQYETYYL